MGSIQSSRASSRTPGTPGSEGTTLDSLGCLRGNELSAETQDGQGPSLHPMCQKNVGTTESLGVSGTETYHDLVL